MTNNTHSKRHFNPPLLNNYKTGRQMGHRRVVKMNNIQIN